MAVYDPELDENVNDVVRRADLAMDAVKKMLDIASEDTHSEQEEKT